MFRNCQGTKRAGTEAGKKEKRRERGKKGRKKREREDFGMCSFFFFFFFTSTCTYIHTGCTENARTFYC
jgi:hypothetical protein